LLLPLLPAWALDSFDYTDTYLDASVSESPDILGTLLIVVVTYFTVMLLYLWLSSFLDEVSPAAAAAAAGRVLAGGSACMELRAACMWWL
jgi:hypothetical protein